MGGGREEGGGRTHARKISGHALTLKSHLKCLPKALNYAVARAAKEIFSIRIKARRLGWNTLLGYIALASVCLRKISRPFGCKSKLRSIPDIHCDPSLEKGRRFAVASEKPRRSMTVI